VARGPTDERPFHLMIEHAFDHLGGGARHQDQIHFGIGLGERDEISWQPQSGGAFERAHAQRAPRRAIVADGPACFSHEMTDALRIGQQAAARRGQGDATAMTLKQGAAEFLLEGTNARGHIRLHCVQFGCGPVHAAEACHRRECLQVGNIHGRFLTVAIGPGV